jgi:zinc protease
MQRRFWIRNLSFVLAAICLVGFLNSSSLQAADAPAPKKIVTVEGITEYQLDNGLRILLFPDPSTSAVTVNLTVLVGSRHEGYGETGMAHLLEHMLFKGCPKYPNVPKALRDHGARFNGTTWVDRTNYFETMPASDENLEFALDLESDRLVNSFVKREDLVSEMTVVRNEFELGENMPDQILSQRMTAVAYEWHNYGKSTIGNRSDIERVPIENLQAFYRKYYQPDDAVLIVAGKFEEGKALGLIAKHFGGLKRPDRQLAETYTEEPPQDGERTVVLRRVGKVGVVGAVYHICAAAHEDHPALAVVSEILATEPTGRLYKALVESHMANQVSASCSAYHDPGILEIDADVASGNPLPPVRDTMIRVLESLATEKITDEEVDRAKRKLLKGIELLLTDSNRVGTALSESIAAGDWRLLFLRRDRLAKVTPADVTRVADRYLKESNRTVGLYIPTTEPQRAEIPSTPNVAELFKTYKGSQNVAQGEAFDPTPENIVKLVQQSELPSGVKAIFLPKKTRGEIVNARLTLYFGNPQSLKGYNSAGSVLADLMLRGTKKHTRQQLQDELDKLKARLDTGAGGGFRAMLMGGGAPGQISFAIECPRGNLPAVLRLLGEVLREPTFPPEELDVLKRQAKDQLDKGLTEPIFLAINFLLRQINPYPDDDVRYVPTIEESIARVKAVSVDQVRKLYEEQVGGQVGELVVVGDFVPDATSSIAEDILRDWKTSTPYQRIEQGVRSSTGQRKAIDTPDKANAVFVSGHTFPMMDTDPEYPALQVGDFIFGESPLSSRLSVRVRGEKGLSYGVGSMLNADTQDKLGVFLMFAITNPRNIDKVDQTISEELAKMIEKGVSEKELEEAKKAYLQQLKVQRSRDSALALFLGARLHAGQTFAYYADLEKKIAALTPEQVSEAFRKFIDPKRLVTVRAGDFKKAESNPKNEDSKEKKGRQQVSIGCPTGVLRPHPIGAKVSDTSRRWPSRSTVTLTVSPILCFSKIE